MYMEFISFIVVYDRRRFSNSEEGSSYSAQLLFDVRLWSMDSIRSMMNDLWFEYFADKCSCVVSGEIDFGYDVLVPFINGNDGVYVNDAYEGDEMGCRLGFGKADKSKRIKPGKKDTVVGWELNGKKSCDYSEKYDKWCEEQRKNR